MSDRLYWYREHPKTCTCVECQERRLGPRKSRKPLDSKAKAALEALLRSIAQEADPEGQ